jgi:hypothetical protein
MNLECTVRYLSGMVSIDRVRSNSNVTGLSQFPGAAASFLVPGAICNHPQTPVQIHWLKIVGISTGLSKLKSKCSVTWLITLQHLGRWGPSANHLRSSYVCINRDRCMSARCLPSQGVMVSPSGMWMSRWQGWELVLY